MIVLLYYFLKKKIKKSLRGTHHSPYYFTTFICHLIWIFDLTVFNIKWYVLNDCTETQVNQNLILKLVVPKQTWLFRFSDDIAG